MKRGRPVKAIYQKEGLLKTLEEEYNVALLSDKDSKVNVFREGLNYITSFELVKAHPELESPKQMKEILKAN